METAQELRFPATRSSGRVSAILHSPPESTHLLVFGHGAGAGMRHAFMEAVAGKLGAHGIATFRYQFPYMERGDRRPDPAPILLKTVRSAVEAALEAAPGLPALLGGKSMGGRMASQAAAKESIPGVAGLVFFGFPLHPAGKPATTRGDHLADVGVPTLFLQGTRDRLADLALLRPLQARLPASTLHVVEDADHSFHVLKRTGRTDDQVLDELADVAANWMKRIA